MTLAPSTTSIRLTNLRLPVEVPELELPKHIARRLGMSVDQLVSWRILRKSLDARAREDLRFVYTIAVDIPHEADSDRLLSRAGVEHFEPAVFDDPPPGSAEMSHRPVVVGAGPAGLLA